ncbi:MAG: DUF2877 domain-containing protein [Anaerolineales bacterium]|nr:DUF2877 domain-containing protein [Anaerolineales bacterium]
MVEYEASRPADAQTDMQPSSAFTQLGSAARDCLTNGQRGKILAVFSKVIYLLTETDELFWITTDDAPMHRRCAIIPSPLPGLSAGSPFRVADHHLTLDPDLLFEIGNPPVWVAPRTNRILDIASLPVHIHSFFSQLDLSQAKGFGNFIPQILALTENNPTQSKFTDPILQFSHPLIVDMAHTCLDHQLSRPPEIADKLIGLGTGLTPSGDDFLGGMLFAVHHLQAAYPDFDFTAYKLQIETYRSRTPFISFTLLKDHASGHAIEPLHRIVNDILSGGSFESISPFVSQLTRIGHSTGWDLLTGLLTGLLITYHNGR